MKIPQIVASAFASEALQLEKRNREMNKFFAELTAKMNRASIKAISLERTLLGKIWTSL